MRCFLFILVLTYSAVGAQDSLHRQLPIPRHAVKWSPFHLMNFYPTIQVAYEHRLSNRMSFQIDYGRIVNFNNDDTDFQNKHGFKVKAEPRYYFGANRHGTFTFYGAVEGYRNQVDFEDKVTTEECFTPDCSSVFIRSFNQKVRYRESGIGFKMGFVKYFSNFLLDVHSGWAMRFIDYDKPASPEGVVNEEGEFFLLDFRPQQVDRDVLQPLIGVRIGYRFR